jgi:hypothetical protein
MAQRELVLRIKAGVLRPSTTLGRPCDGAVRHAFALAGVANALEPVHMGPPGPRPMCEPIEKQQTDASERS